MQRLRSHLRRHFKQGFRFAVCGVIGAAIEFFVLYVLVSRLALTPVIAYIFSGGIPAVFVFLFNRHVTFRVSDGSSKRQSKRFILVYVSTFALNYCLSSSFYLLGLHVLLPLPIAQTYALTSLSVAYGAKVMAIAVTAVVNYSFSHLFIFKREPMPLSVF